MKAPELASEVGQGGEEGEGHGGVDVVGRGRQLTCRDLEELPGDQGTGPVAHKDEEEDGRHKGHPGPVERLSQVVLGDVGGEAKGHFLEVPGAGGSTEFTDGRLGMAGHLRADADHAAGREEPGREQRGPRERARHCRCRGCWGRQRRVALLASRSAHGPHSAAELLRAQLGTGASWGDEAAGGMEGQAKSGGCGRAAQERRSSARHVLPLIFAGSAGGLRHGNCGGGFLIQANYNIAL